MSDDRDPSGFRIVLAAVQPVVVVPAISILSTTANLANGAFIDLEFQIDQTPLLDLILSSDRDLLVQTFVRIDQTDTFRQIDTDGPYTTSAGYTRMLDGKRFGGSLLRIRITNNSGANTTRLSAEAQARSS